MLKRVWGVSRGRLEDVSWDGKLILLSDRKKHLIRVINWLSGQMLLEISGWGGYFNYFNPDASLIAIEHEKGVQVWHIATGKLLFQLDDASKPHFKATGQLLCVWSSRPDSHLCVIEVSSGKTLLKIKGSRYWISPDGRMLKITGFKPKPPTIHLMSIPPEPEFDLVCIQGQDTRFGEVMRVSPYGKYNTHNVN